VKLRYTKRAAAQIDAALAFVAERSPQGAGNIAQRLFALLTLLTEQPHAGQPTTRAGVRRLSASPYPYVIDYRANDKEIVVLRFRHSSRRPIR
jgi:plasmid stabilization system protein ParE